ncbi:hypothetical protein DEFDS_P170 (plasmid) [Deferribacter desulfuricans SSM1]|uniref:Uncharacterized protein n=1 Tax=Deferribacter desulfuricans (strain DSM 14783 / JCM 11476 / NBRC 101012 / SSM1) TaxID=639282 RepID=D3PEZ8_DEFDS|nr:hypothetical protein [Deferribacter desulfuricans]BAI81790.1 hypothetical protein DEFDS_P170 [Deferribacter desulfuricans SSM1]
MLTKITSDLVNNIVNTLKNKVNDYDTIQDLPLEEQIKYCLKTTHLNNDEKLALMISTSFYFINKNKYNDFNEHCINQLIYYLIDIFGTNSSVHNVIRIIKNTLKNENLFEKDINVII